MVDPHAPQAKSSEAVQDLSGTTVGRFTIRTRLGGGGMGEVYRAEDTKLKRPVALKRVAPQLRADDRYRQRLLKEAERASALSTEHIAGLYDVLEEDGEVFLVMEYVEGETLRQRLARPLDIEQFLKIAVQCAEALVAAHAGGIVHRDLKPDNIMLTPAGQVKVLDFGVAKRLPRPDQAASTETLDPASATGGLSGTPAYMAPETLLEKESDARADIFSLGVVFYEALTGQHPFRAGSFLATTDRILHESPAPLTELNPRVPAELERIVAKMLPKRPEERYATASDLLVDLRAAYPRPLPRPRPRPWFRQRRWAAAAALAVGLAVVAALVWQFWPRRPTERIRVAVLPFANPTGDVGLEPFRLPMTQMLVGDLTESPNIQMVPYEQLLAIIRGFEDGGSDISSPEAIQAVASYSGARFILIPRMFAVGNTVRVSVEFRDTQTGEMVTSTKAEREFSGAAEDTLYSLLGPLAEGVQEYFRRAGRGRDYPPPTPGSRPKTAVAAVHLNEGRNAFARGEYARALASFERAAKEDSGFALTYAWMSRIYGLLGYDDKARQVAEQAAGLITGQTPVTDAYFIAANLAERNYNYAAARDKYLELIRLYPDDPQWQAGLAGVYEREGSYQEALARYQEVLVRDPNYIVARQALSSLYSKTGDPPQAITEGEKALGLYRALRNREGEASLLLDLGEISRQGGDQKQANQYIQQGLELFQSLANEFGILRATFLLGNLHFSQGDYGEARRYWNQVLSTSGQVRNNRLVVTALMNIGVSYSREGDYAKAVDYYEQSVSKQWPAVRERAQAMTNLAGIYIEYGPDPQRGFELAQEALATFQKMGDAQSEGRVRTLKGLHLANSGSYDQALGEIQQAQALFRRSQYKRGLAQATYEAGRSYFKQNRYELALGSFEDTLAQFQALESPFDVANAKIHLGWTHRRLGDAAQAEALLKEALQAAQENNYGELLPEANNALGEVYRESGQLEEARRSFQKASDLWREPNVSEFSIEARSNLGVLEAEQGDMGQGLTRCRQALARAQQLNRWDLVARARLNLARVHLRQRHFSQALELLAELTKPGERSLGLEFRAQAYALQARALEGLGRTGDARTSFAQAEEALRHLEQSLAANHRESFARRPDIHTLVPRNSSPQGTD